ncbi:class I SAM-dependent methyltransferase [Phytomonospora endophytica]|uniref:SAM-dependent methyltransferase n=1 Tax=Phytomonospora endophytica TaxID=714109 RepID=A0A841FGT5_9ACTN|nr:class I SAM-dependent methyltransferase [Phytomonospora endophytica]MBB6033058.1 SAM-dependent methyltransferase [Phytomonospora endophytica]GIG65285.1 methyltransferase type 11 [Phytomonospora endophytica]
MSPIPERRMSFNASAAAYHRGRPPYPDAVFDLLTTRCGLRPGVRVLELGAGNGLATGPLLAAGAHVTAVEPGAELAAILRERFAGDELSVVVADFETAEVTGSFDLAVAATSLHWLDPGVSIAKLARLVEPGGWLAAWWTEFGDVARPSRFRDRLDEVYRDLLPDEPGYRDSRARGRQFEHWTGVITSGGHFGDPAIEVIDWHQTLTGDGARELWSTFPNIGELAPGARAEFLDRLSRLVDEEPGGTVDDPRQTVVYTAERVTG